MIESGSENNLESLRKSRQRSALPELSQERSVPGISSIATESEGQEQASPKNHCVEGLRVRAERKEQRRKRHLAVPEKIALRPEKYPVYLRLMENEIKMCNKNIERFRLQIRTTVITAKLKNIPQNEVTPDGGGVFTLSVD